MSGIPGSDYILFSCLLNTILFSLSSAWIFYKFRLPAYHVMALYQVYFFAGFVLRPWELYFTQKSQLWDYVGFVPNSDAILWGTVLIVIAHFSILAGFFYVNGRGSAVPQIQPFTLVPGRPLSYFSVLAAFLVLGAYASTTQYGGVSSLEDALTVSVITDDAGGQRQMEISGYQTIFEELIPVTLIALFSTRRMRTIALICVVTFVVYRSFVGAGRHKFVITLMALGFILLIDYRRRLPPIKLMLGAGLVLAMFNFVGSDRLALRKIAAGELTLSEFVDNYFLSRGEAPLTGDMKEYDVFNSVVSVVPDKSGFTYGTQYLRLLVWPIPRQLWNDKPVYTSIVDLLKYGNFAYLTITLFADSYMTIGLLGMVAILFSISACINLLYKQTISKPHSAEVLMIYFMILIYSPIIFRDGPVAAAYFIIATSVGVILMCRAGRLVRLPR